MRDDEDWSPQLSVAVVPVWTVPEVRVRAAIVKLTTYRRGGLKRLPGGSPDASMPAGPLATYEATSI